MKKGKEAWDDIYQNSTMSDQTLRDNKAKFCKDNLSLNPIKVHDRNDVEPEAIHLPLLRLGPKRAGGKKAPVPVFPV